MSIKQLNKIIMKKILIVIAIHSLFLSCAQIYPLNTNTDVPSNAYIKDANNELIPYEGIWKGTWDNKTFSIEFKRIKKYLDHKENNPYYKDVLIGKFKVINSNNLVLFDNTYLSDNDAKVEGGGFIKNTEKYLLHYNDFDICGINGSIRINFINSIQTNLNWQFSDTTDIITPECSYYNANPFPQPLPKNIVLIKQ